MAGPSRVGIGRVNKILVRVIILDLEHGFEDVVIVNFGQVADIPVTGDWEGKPSLP